MRGPGGDGDHLEAAISTKDAPGRPAETIAGVSPFGGKGTSTGEAGEFTTAGAEDFTSLRDMAGGFATCEDESESLERAQSVDDEGQEVVVHGIDHDEAPSDPTEHETDGEESDVDVSKECADERVDEVEHFETHRQLETPDTVPPGISLELAVGTSPWIDHELEEPRSTTRRPDAEVIEEPGAAEAQEGCMGDDAVEAGAAEPASDFDDPDGFLGDLESDFVEELVVDAVDFERPADTEVVDVGQEILKQDAEGRERAGNAHAPDVTSIQQAEEDTVAEIVESEEYSEEPWFRNRHTELSTEDLFIAFSRQNAAGDVEGSEEVRDALNHLAREAARARSELYAQVGLAWESVLLEPEQLSVDVLSELAEASPDGATRSEAQEVVEAPHASGENERDEEDASEAIIDGDVEPGIEPEEAVDEPAPRGGEDVESTVSSWNDEVRDIDVFDETALRTRARSSRANCVPETLDAPEASEAVFDAERDLFTKVFQLAGPGRASWYVESGSFGVSMAVSAEDATGRWLESSSQIEKEAYECRAEAVSTTRSTALLTFDGEVASEPECQQPDEHIEPVALLETDVAGAVALPGGTYLLRDVPAEWRPDLKLVEASGASGEGVGLDEPDVKGTDVVEYEDRAAADAAPVALLETEVVGAVALPAQTYLLRDAPEDWEPSLTHAEDAEHDLDDQEERIDAVAAVEEVETSQEVESAADGHDTEAAEPVEESREAADAQAVEALEDVGENEEAELAEEAETDEIEAPEEAEEVEGEDQEAEEVEQEDQEAEEVEGEDQEAEEVEGEDQEAEEVEQEDQEAEEVEGEDQEAEEVEQEDQEAAEVEQEDQEAEEIESEALPRPDAETDVAAEAGRDTPSTGIELPKPAHSDSRRGALLKSLAQSLPKPDPSTGADSESRADQQGTEFLEDVDFEEVNERSLELSQDTQKSGHDELQCEADVPMSEHSEYIEFGDATNDLDAGGEGLNEPTASYQTEASKLFDSDISAEEKSTKGDQNSSTSTPRESAAGAIRSLAKGTSTERETQQNDTADNAGSAPRAQILKARTFQSPKPEQSGVKSRPSASKRFEKKVDSTLSQTSQARSGSASDWSRPSGLIRHGRGEKQGKWKRVPTKYRKQASNPNGSQAAKNTSKPNAKSSSNASADWYDSSGGSSWGSSTSPGLRSAMTRKVDYDNMARGKDHQQTVRVPVLSNFDGFGQEAEKSSELVQSQNEILQLYRDFVVSLRRCGMSDNSPSFHTFSRRVSVQREKARERYGTGSLEMNIKISKGKPVIVIRPN
jgi:hypothetical protein